MPSNQSKPQQQNTNNPLLELGRRGLYEWERSANSSNFTLPLT